MKLDASPNCMRMDGEAYENASTASSAASASSCASITVRTARASRLLTPAVPAAPPARLVNTITVNSVQRASDLTLAVSRSDSLQIIVRACAGQRVSRACNQAGESSMLYMIVEHFKND